ncbi:hypothetical protein MAF45_10835 [Mesosutterella sp. OilRF-GAM-744-9]|uniref:Uncharacterized protein n=1 Tax=Mesosutterella porci TaxID=2915351 RepID=A0ABS9MTI4_9BURK|nr:hypothetical protein [Mesosutterella sp. oilRF-744-WT-GAM-9]MCG5031931.1 hypothetical protein [Mesosutterella sp. oilRF-744-WT-GAM-9]
MKIRPGKLLLALALSAWIAAILAGTALLVHRLSGSWAAAAAAAAACLALRLTLIPSLLTAWYLFAYTDWSAAALIAGGFGFGGSWSKDGPRGLPDLALRLFREGLGLKKPDRPSDRPDRSNPPRRSH